MPENPRTRKPFLTARWEFLVMLNYEISPSILEPFLPLGTELDLWDGRCFVSLVGFRFLETRVLGFPIPFHRNFEELNLRFYVRRRMKDQVRRGVVFVKELVPRWAIATVARTVYGEPYHSCPMRHGIQFQDSDGAVPKSVFYEWYWAGRWNRMGAIVEGESCEIVKGSEHEFITEHYWGYTKCRNGSTREYQVEHPQWRTWDTRHSVLDADVVSLYGSAFGPYLIGQPSSALLADGSVVSVSPHHEAAR